LRAENKSLESNYSKKVSDLQEQLNKFATDGLSLQQQSQYQDKIRLLEEREQDLLWQLSRSNQELRNLQQSHELMLNRMNERQSVSCKIKTSQNILIYEP
jgi:hypothetical protein